MELNLLCNIGEKTTKLFQKIGVNSVEDLLEYYPYKYELIKFSNIDYCSDDLVYYVFSTIVTEPKISFIRKNFNRLSFVAESNNKTFNVTIFNRAFLKKNLIVGKRVVLVGKYKKINNTFIANDIKFNIDSEKIEAKYHLTDGISNSNIIKFVGDALIKCNNVFDYIPDYLNDKYDFLDKMSAIKKIHQPESITDIKKSKLKLIYEELFVYMFKINYLKKINGNVIGLKKEFDNNEVEDFLNKLPFRLTIDQESVINEILNDMTLEKRMNRLVLGDVGSGKTIVAIVAMYANYLSHYQAAFMVPTEVLAQQHFKSVENYFKDYDIKVALVTGSLSKKEKMNIYKSISDGSIDIVIGTHSLLNEELEFNNLGLVITDEQHRFGVNQRKILQNKGLNEVSDVLYLSATPIPRTYALTIYGDLDLSQIKTKPESRKEIVTKVFTENDIRIVLEKMVEELRLGHQIFVVSPLILDNEELDLNSVIELKEKFDRAFNKQVNIDILHGKLKNKEKELLMSDFLNKKIQILISTTVIEVGIDIPNATMMVIFNADRFGLATLHQLRGRVGRNSVDSYCYLISNSKNNKRLKVMEESNDGFYIAECDFKQRGQGDLFGIKQSGDMTFKMANIMNDYKVMQQANIDSKEFIDNNEYLKSNLYKEIIDNINFLN